MRLNRDELERETLDALDRYWDAVAAGERVVDGSLDPAIAAAVRTVHDRDDTPAPNPAFLARLGRQLEAEAGARIGRSDAPLPSADGPGGHDLLPEHPAATDRAETPRRSWRRWVRESAGMAAAAVVLVAVAGLLVAVLQGRGTEPGEASTLVATSSDFTISLSSQGRDGDRLLLALMIEPTDPEAMPDLKSLGEFVGWRSESDGHLDGLADPLGKPKWVVPVAESTREGGRWDTIVTGYSVGLSLRMLREPDQPVSITITRLVFRQPDGTEREFPGEWRFTFVPADIAEEVHLPGLEAIEPVLATLREAGLVFDIEQTFEIGGDAPMRSGTITLHWLAVDRDATYLGFTADPPELAEITLLDERGLPVGLLSDGMMAAYLDMDADGRLPGTRWESFAGLDPATREVRIVMQPNIDPNMVAPGTASRVPVTPAMTSITVDLSPLADLPEPRPAHGSATANGVTIEAAELRRGVAVSTLTLRTTVLDPGAVTPMLPDNGDSLADIQNAPILWHHGISPAISATVDGEPVTVIGQGEVRGAGVQDRPIRLVNLPEKGTLHLSIPWWWGRITSDEADPLMGPWELTIDLTTGVGPPPGMPSPTPSDGSG